MDDPYLRHSACMENPCCWRLEVNIIELANIMYLYYAEYNKSIGAKLLLPSHLPNEKNSMFAEQNTLTPILLLLPQCS